MKKTMVKRLTVDLSYFNFQRSFAIARLCHFDAGASLKCLKVKHEFQSYPFLFHYLDKKKGFGKGHFIQEDFSLLRNFSRHQSPVQRGIRAQLQPQWSWSRG